MRKHKIYEKFYQLSGRLFTALMKKDFGAIGKGSIIDFPTHLVNPEGMFLGHTVRIMAGSWLQTIKEWGGAINNGRIYIGDFSTVAYDVQISASSSITIGKNVGIGRGSVISDHLHDYRFLDQPILYAPITEGKPIVIEDDSFIGVNCVISPGVHIGKHVFIAANSTVTKDIPSFSFAIGSPAKVIRRYDFDKGHWAGVSIKHKNSLL